MKIGKTVICKEEGSSKEHIFHMDNVEIKKHHIVLLAQKDNEHNGSLFFFKCEQGGNRFSIILNVDDSQIEYSEKNICLVDIGNLFKITIKTDSSKQIK